MHVPPGQTVVFTAIARERRETLPTVRRHLYELLRPDSTEGWGKWEKFLFWEGFDVAVRSNRETAPARLLRFPQWRPLFPDP